MGSSAGGGGGGSSSSYSAASSMTVCSSGAVSPRPRLPEAPPEVRPRPEALPPRPTAPRAWRRPGTRSGNRRPTGSWSFRRRSPMLGSGASGSRSSNVDDDMRVWEVGAMTLTVRRTSSMPADESPGPPKLRLRGNRRGPAAKGDGNGSASRSSVEKRSSLAAISAIERNGEVAEGPPRGLEPAPPVAAMALPPLPSGVGRSASASASALAKESPPSSAPHPQLSPADAPGEMSLSAPTLV